MKVSTVTAAYEKEQRGLPFRIVWLFADRHFTASMTFAEVCVDTQNVCMLCCA